MTKKKRKIKKLTRRIFSSHYPHSWWFRSICFIISWPISQLLRLWFVTCRVKVVDKERDNFFLNQNLPVLYTSWHCGLLYFVYHFRSRNGVILASRSMLGELISAILKRMKLTPARGSSRKKGVDKGGSRALLEMEEYIKEGYSAGTVTDAPRGPRYISKVGIVILAQRTGVPILPVIWAAKNFYMVPNWDQTILPYPFTQIVFYYGNPIHVPAQATSEEVEKIRLQLTETLNKMRKEANEYFNP